MDAISTTAHGYYWPQPYRFCPNCQPRCSCCGGPLHVGPNPQMPLWSGAPYTISCISWNGTSNIVDAPSTTEPSSGL